MRLQASEAFSESKKRKEFAGTEEAPSEKNCKKSEALGQIP